MPNRVRGKRARAVKMVSDALGILRALKVPKEQQNERYVRNLDI